VSVSIVAASYERVSTLIQGRSGYSLGAQRQSLEDFVAARGWMLPAHLQFRDGESENASGGDYNLPGLNEMLEAARRKEFQTLVIPDYDRFARSMTKALVLKEQLGKYGVRLVCQRIQVDDSPEGRLLENQMLSFAEYEREKIRLRTMLGRRRKAEVGKVVGLGGPPFGYRFTYESIEHQQKVFGLEPDPATAPIALRILQTVRYRSTLDVADELNREGIPSPTGKRWLNKVIQRMATNPVYVGTWIYGRFDQRCTPEDHNGVAVTVPALISRDEWDANQRALAHRMTARRGQIPREEDPNLLRGALTCGHCHGGLSVATNQGTRYYRCLCHYPARARRYSKAICDLPDVHAVDLEEELWSILGETLLDVDYLAAGLEAARTKHDEADQLRKERLDAQDAQIARQRQRLDNLATKIADAGDGEAFAALMRQSKDIEALLDRFTKEKAELAALHADGLSSDDALEIEAFAEQIREGLAYATPADRRRLYELLQLRGKVYLDPDGVRLGRKHSFRIEWQAPIQLRHNSSRFRNPVMQWMPPPAFISSLMSTV
jgi:site-specific DNA recombinase